MQGRNVVLATKEFDNNSPFNYSSVSPEVTIFLKGQANRILRCAGSSVVKAGKDLLIAKQYLSHGAFLRWVETEAGIPARTAQAYMRAAQWIEDKSAVVSHLPPSVLYVLSSPSVPEDFIQDILSRTEAGERIAPSFIRREIKAICEARRKGKASRLLSKQAVLDREEAGIERYEANQALARLVEAVDILRRGLTANNYVRVSTILTNMRSVDSQQLAQSILMAFSTLRKDHARLRGRSGLAPHSGDMLLTTKDLTSTQRHWTKHYNEQARTINGHR
jgi:hypothetical protein